MSRVGGTAGWPGVRVGGTRVSRVSRVGGQQDGHGYGWVGSRVSRVGGEQSGQGLGGGQQGGQRLEWAAGWAGIRVAGGYC